MIRFVSRLVCVFGAAALTAACAHQPANRTWRIPLDSAPVQLEPAGRLDFPPISESSGIVRSRQYPDIFWTHNDSGDEARLFAVHRDGSVFIPEWASGYAGIPIPNAANIDWEDIATDSEGNLYIGAFGNNGNARRDLGIYVVREPNPGRVAATRAERLVRFFYPDQTAFPPEAENFDCEALFHAFGKLYLITKHRADAGATLYRLDSTDPDRTHVLKKLAVAEGIGTVTAADATPGGERLAVLTYTALWVFESPKGGDDWFSGSAHWMPIEAKQAEAVCFVDEDTILITNEQRDVFEVTLSGMQPAE